MMPINLRKFVDFDTNSVRIKQKVETNENNSQIQSLHLLFQSCIERSYG